MKHVTMKYIKTVLLFSSRLPVFVIEVVDCSAGGTNQDSKIFLNLLGADQSEIRVDCLHQGQLSLQITVLSQCQRTFMWLLQFMLVPCLWL